MGNMCLTRPPAHSAQHPLHPFSTLTLFIAEKRADDPFTDEDIAAQDAMRLNWFEDRLFSDPFTTEVVPYEIWSLHSLPPEIKF